MKFRMYSNADGSMETISIVEAESFEQAEMLFASIKSLPLKSFKELYSVEVYERR